MVHSMHNEADAEDYIVWHRIWICIDYLQFDLAAGVCVPMCTVHHLQTPGPRHSRGSLRLVQFIIFSPRRADIVFRLLVGKGLNTRQACQLFRPVRDMRRRRLAQLLIRDLDITMKTDKSFLLPPVQSLRSCLNSRPGSHQAFKTNVFDQGSIFQHPKSINDVMRSRYKTNAPEPRERESEKERERKGATIMRSGAVKDSGCSLVSLLWSKLIFSAKLHSF